MLPEQTGKLVIDALIKAENEFGTGNFANGEKYQAEAVQLLEGYRTPKFRQILAIHYCRCAYLSAPEQKAGEWFTHTERVEKMLQQFEKAKGCTAFFNFADLYNINHETKIFFARARFTMALIYFHTFSNVKQFAKLLDEAKQILRTIPINERTPEDIAYIKSYSLAEKIKQMENLHTINDLDVISKELRKDTLFTLTSKEALYARGATFSSPDEFFFNDSSSSSDSELSNSDYEDSFDKPSDTEEEDQKLIAKDLETALKSADSKKYYYKFNFAVQNSVRFADEAKKAAELFCEHYKGWSCGKSLIGSSSLFQPAHEPDQKSTLNTEYSFVFGSLKT